MNSLANDLTLLAQRAQRGKVNSEQVKTTLGALGKWMRSHPTKAFAVCVVLYRHAGQRSEVFRGGRVRERFSKEQRG